MHMHSLRKVALLALLSTVWPIAAVQAQWVRTGPPPIRAERRVAPPGRGYVWISGYYRWDGRRYLWVGGRWVLPPRTRAVWIPGRWENSPRGWFWKPGHWRG